MTFLRLALALLTIAAAGAAPALLLRSRTWRGGWLSLAGHSYALGFGLVGLVSVLLMMAGARVSAAVPPVLAALSLAVAAIRFQPPAAPAATARWLPRLLPALPALAALGLAVIDDDPGWDVRAFWSLKARSIERHGTFRNPDFQEDLRPHPHPRYPLLVPSVHAWIHAATGTFDGRHLRIAMALFFAASLAVVLAALRDRVPEPWALACTAVYGMTPALLTAEGGGAVSAYADYPLAVFLLLAAVNLRAWIADGDVRAAAAAGFALACLPQIKDEGLAMAAVLSVLAALFAFRSGGFRSASRTAAIPAAGLLVGLLWLLVRRSLLNDPSHLSESQGIAWSWLPEILRRLASQMVRWKEWTLLWPAIVLLAAFRPPRLRDSDSLLPWAAVAMLLIYVAVWTMIPYGSAGMSTSHNVNRLVLHVMPIAFVWAAGRLPSALDERPQALA